MARIYQNEKVLMKEVGLIKEYKMVITSEIVEDFEGTARDAVECGQNLANIDNVKSVEVYQRK